MKKSSQLALRAMLLYCVLAGAWIIFSDRVLALLVSDVQWLTTIQTYKGLAFVAISAGGLYFMLRTQLRRWEKEMTERTQAEQALHANQEKLQAIFDAEPECLKLLEADGTLHEINPAGLQIVEAERISDLTGHSILSLVVEESRVAVQAMLAAVASGEKRSMEFKIVGLKGTSRWLEMHAVPVRDPGIGRNVILAVSRDVSERKQAQETMQRLARQNDMILNTAGEGIWGLDHEGKATFINAAGAQMLGYDPQELIGRDMHVLVHHSRADGSPHPVEQCPIRRALRDGQVHRCGDDVFWRKDGTSFPVHYVSNPLREKDAVVGAVVVFSNMTEQRKMEAHFRQAQKMEAIGRLAGGVAHDFNNILAVIQMQAGLLKVEKSLTERQLDFASEIDEAAERAANLTRQLLLFSRQQALRPRELDLNEIVTNMSRMVQRLLGQQIQMDLKLSAEPLRVLADPGMMDQIFLNLTLNGRDAMPQGGQLTVETSPVEIDERAAAEIAQARAGSFVCLSVTDSGCGIAPEVLPRIFEPFFTTKEVGKGTGLGLATVFGVVQQHQGWIQVSSQVGHTTFRVYLPRLVAG